MFRFVYYCTLKQQIWELEMAIQRVAHWLTSQQCWMDVKFGGYIRIEIQQNIEKFDQKRREHKAMLSTDKCTLQILKKELHDSYHTSSSSYCNLRRRKTCSMHYYSDWME